MSISLGLLAAAAGAAVIYGSDSTLEITDYTICNSKIPRELDNLKIAHLSDIHSRIPSKLIPTLSKQCPDIICITGDLAHDNGAFEPLVELVGELSSLASLFIISGNHDIWRGDYEQFVRACRQKGAHWLRNESTAFEKNGKKIYISGIDDPFSTLRDKIEKSIEKNLTQLTPMDGFNMLLFHRANLLDTICGKGYDLILSGHMHGGQIRIPHLGGVVCPKSNLNDYKNRPFFPKYSGGQYTLGECTAIVSRGIGNTAPLPRLYNRPEICMITLKTKNN